MQEAKSEELKSLEKKEYQNLVNQVKPKPPLLKNFLWAFGVGGFICVIAQMLLNYLLFRGMSETDAGSSVAVVMVFLGALLTGIGVYDKIGEKAGAGSIVPITGFANVIIASAMEFKREGYIFGVGARIFSIAGPTLLFGFTASVLIGLISYWLK